MTDEPRTKTQALLVARYNVTVSSASLVGMWLRNYHHLHLLLLAHSFILNLKLGSSTNHFLHRPFPFLPDWRTLGPFNVFILLNGWICLHGVLVRLSRLKVGFRTHLKSLRFHFISFQLQGAVTKKVTNSCSITTLRQPEPLSSTRNARE